MRLRWCRCLRLPVLLHANNQFQKGDELYQIQKDLNFLRLTIVIIIMVLSVFSLCILFHHYIMIRKKEFALLKINGLSQKNIYYLIHYELKYFLFYGYFIPSIMIIICLYLFKLSISLYMLFTIYGINLQASATRPDDSANVEKLLMEVRCVYRLGLII